MNCNITKYNFMEDWSFDLISNMKNNATYVFTIENGMCVFVEHDSNLDAENTFGWSVAIFDNDMNNLECFGCETLYDLECDFKIITQEIYNYYTTFKEYSINDFKTDDVAYEKALAEISNKKIFDEFGNLIKEID